MPTAFAWAWCKFSPLGMATQSRGHGTQVNPAFAAFVHTGSHGAAPCVSMVSIEIFVNLEGLC
jgi:hypothetical protein